ncbi:hypothetical protein [Microlunatus soli]|uniref:Uncharacterized protein n=1 Tax=Microlunatus soli TaxID=630515 RepID=A0A1H1N6W0_9ACTN|nr:hypothetical protein [Microlunatus soli]SDR94620.1 hypothetical protein SAMN04489812_0401 [Microlunatus soli]
MTEHPDIPEADRAEQEQEAWPAQPTNDPDREIDSSAADVADQLDQAHEVPPDEDQEIGEA